MGLPGSLPIGMPVSFQNMGMLGGFPQMWATAAGQQYAGGLVNAGQLHELYGGVNGVEVPPPAHNQQSSSGAGDAQSSALYRWDVTWQVNYDDDDDEWFFCVFVWLYFALYLVAVWYGGTALVSSLDQRSYSALGFVSTRIGNHSQAWVMFAV